MSSTFTALGIRAELAERLALAGISAPTPVQETAIPVLLQDKDAIVQAQTGTGKTLAFALPVLQHIHAGKTYTQALILTPTRELAIQITSELASLAPVLGISVLAAYGGQDVESQIRKLKNPPHIVVATPGRLLDHLRRETISLTSIRMLVLDEADQMLHMGFLSEVEAIIDQCSLKRQTTLFSATMPDAVKQLAARYMDYPQDIRIKSAAVTLDAIEQRIIMTTDRNKQPLLLRLIETENPYLAVVFCRTKLRAKKLTEELQAAGVPADELHGDLTQSKREAVMKRFRSAKLQVLVATDVAARGLDVEGVTHVFNYDAPADGDSYIHRIGRTGRAGEKGKAITLATPRDRTNLDTIEQKIKATIKRTQGADYGVGLPYSQETFEEHERPPARGSVRSNALKSGSSSRSGASGGRSGGSRAPRSGRPSDKPAGRGATRAAARTADRPAGRGTSDRPAGRGTSDRPAGRTADRSAGAKPTRSWSDDSSASTRREPGRGGSASRSQGTGRPSAAGGGRSAAPGRPGPAGRGSAPAGRGGSSRGAAGSSSTRRGGRDGGGSGQGRRTR